MIRISKCHHEKSACSNTAILCSPLEVAVTTADHEFRFSNKDDTVYLNKSFAMLCSFRLQAPLPTRE